jgi:anti-anti-sigma factor
MEIITSAYHDVIIVKISGKLDSSNSEQALQVISPLITNHCKLIFDMKDCSYLSSAGLRVLLVTAKQLARVGGKGVLLNLIEEIKDVMQMTGFDNIFKIFESFETAIEAIQKE